MNHGAERLIAQGVVLALGDRSIGPIDFAVGPGEVLAILGPVGAGKSSVIEALAGLRAPSAGEIRRGARLLSNVRTVVRGPERGTAALLQDVGLWEHLSARRNCEEVQRAFGSAAAVDRLLDELGFAADRERAARSLSGGEKKKAALARALSAAAPTLLLDEPLAHLDPAARAHLGVAILAAVARAGSALIVTGHTEADVAPFAPGQRLVLA